jgi:hypothetical protein
MISSSVPLLRLPTEEHGRAAVQPQETDRNRARVRRLRTALRWGTDPGGLRGLAPSGRTAREPARGCVPAAGAAGAAEQPVGLSVFRRREWCSRGTTLPPCWPVACVAYPLSSFERTGHRNRLARGFPRSRGIRLALPIPGARTPPSPTRRWKPDMEQHSFLSSSHWPVVEIRRSS